MFTFGQAAVVAYDDDSLALFDQFIEKSENRLGGLGIKVSGRFVGDNHRWVVG